MVKINNKMSSILNPIPSLLDSPHFNFFKEPAAIALWVVFSLLFAAMNAGVMYFVRSWSIEIMTIWAVN